MNAAVAMNVPALAFVAVVTAVATTVTADGHAAAARRP